MKRTVLPIPDGICMSCFDGCMCQLEAPHQGLHECNVNHPINRWTTQDGERWLLDIFGGHANTPPTTEPQ